MSTQRVANRKTTKRANDLRKDILAFNHLKENRMLNKLRCFNREQLFQFLNKKGFFGESEKFYLKNVDGPGFICLMTKPEGLYILDKEFLLNADQTINLQILYQQILLFRMKHCKNFQRDELPFYCFY